MHVLRRLALLMAAAAALTQPVAALATEDTSRAEIEGLKSKFIDVDGVRARYYEEGKGRDTVLIIPSGFTAGSATINIAWRNIRGLSKKYRVIAVDRLASGLTGNPTDDTQYSFQSDARFIYAFIQKKNLGRVNLVGLSAGNSISLILATEHPEVIKTLILSSKGPLNGPQGTYLDAGLAKCPSDETTYDYMRCRAELLPLTPASFDEAYWKADEYMAMSPKNVEARAKMKAGAGEPERTKNFPAFRQQFFERLKGGNLIQMPVLMFGAKQDRLDWDKEDAASRMKTVLALHDAIAAQNPNVKLVIYNHAGHFLWHEQSEQFNADVSEFIEYWNRKGLK